MLVYSYIYTTRHIASVTGASEKTFWHFLDITPIKLPLCNARACPSTCKIAEAARESKQLPSTSCVSNLQISLGPCAPTPRCENKPLLGQVRYRKTYDDVVHERQLRHAWLPPRWSREPSGRRILRLVEKVTTGVVGGEWTPLDRCRTPSRHNCRHENRGRPEERKVADAASVLQAVRSRCSPCRRGARARRCEGYRSKWRRCSTNQAALRETRQHFLYLFRVCTHVCGAPSAPPHPHYVTTPTNRQTLLATGSVESSTLQKKQIKRLISC